MLDIDQIRQLIDMMVANDLVEISLRSGELEVSLRRPNKTPGEDLRVPGARPQTPGGDENVSTQTGPTPTQADAEAELLQVRSPMVGTFYAGPDPESPPFVEVGSEVGPETVVCLLEAMKVFSEIKAEVSGVIERILVKNEEAVEYGQPLFLVRPS